MNCIAFPDMFTANTTNKYYEGDATKICLYLLLNSESGEMFGDPDFGVKLRKYFFNQNNYILKDVIIDEIYSKISIFCPQITLNRKNITLVRIKEKLIVNITYQNNKDFTPDSYNIVLFKGE